MSIIWYYLGGLLFGAIFALPFVSSRKKEDPVAVLAAHQEDREEGTGEEVYQALKAAYFGLIDQKGAKCFGFQKHGATGFGPWLAACMKKFEEGEEVTAAVALTAMRFTRDELAGSRFNLESLEDGISRLEYLVYNR